MGEPAPTAPSGSPHSISPSQRRIKRQRHRGAGHHLIQRETAWPQETPFTRVCDRRVADNRTAERHGSSCLCSLAGRRLDSVAQAASEGVATSRELSS
jgi:hypothetical protein